MKKTTYTFLAIGTVAFAAASLLSACIKDDPDSPGFEYMPDMYRSPSVETNGINPWNVKDTNNMMMGNMLPPEGAVPRGFTPFPYENSTTGDSLASIYWKRPPSIPLNDSIEAEGKFLFTRFCVYCHGDKGDGQGKLVTSGKFLSTPPSYLKLYEDGKLTDGHVYFVITYGIRNMGSHASQITPEQRWKIIEYVERLGRGGEAWSTFSAKKNPADSAKVTP